MARDRIKDRSTSASSGFEIGSLLRVILSLMLARSGLVNEPTVSPEAISNLGDDPDCGSLAVRTRHVDDRCAQLGFSHQIAKSDYALESERLTTGRAWSPRNWCASRASRPADGLGLGLSLEVASDSGGCPAGTARLGCLALRYERRMYPVEHDCTVDHASAHVAAARQVVHDVEQHLFEDCPQALSRPFPGEVPDLRPPRRRRL